MNLPEIGPNVPRRGNGFMRWCGRRMYARKGWKLVGEFPNVPKAVLIGVPHTSNMDGYYAIGAMLALGLRVQLMAKDSLFRWHSAWFMRWLGFIPIDRSVRTGVVEQTVEKFSEYEKLILVVAPEGTRGGAEVWKTGFYQIAQKAGVPIILGGIDYNKRELSFGGAFYPTGDLEADLEKLYAHYRQFEPEHRDRLSGPLREPS